MKRLVLPTGEDVFWPVVFWIRIVVNLTLILAPARLLGMVPGAIVSMILVIVAGYWIEFTAGGAANKILRWAGFIRPRARTEAGARAS